MTTRVVRLGLVIAVLAAIGAAPACVSKPPAAPGAPKFADLPVPDIPDTLRATQAIRDLHAGAWQRLQAGDLRGATRGYTEILRLSPPFYPAHAGLGAVALADGKFKDAAVHYRAALGENNRYVPAWRGLVDAEAGAGNDEEAIAALERLLALDDSREGDRTRLELLRLRQVQGLIDAGTRARQAGRLDEASGLFTRALTLSPSSTAVLRELVQLNVAAERLEQAEEYARKAVAIDKNDAAAHGALASILEARGRQIEAAAELAQAAALDPATWGERADAARARLTSSGGPPQMRDLASATQVTRGQLAALIEMRLAALLRSAPSRVPDVATDARGNWAADAIMTVTRSGVMDVFPNHTFQPGGVVRRADLAETVARLVALAMSGNAATLGTWQAARPAFADVGQSNLFYRSAALAVTAGAMATNAGRFEPTRGATGTEVLAAITRIERLTAGRLPFPLEAVAK